MFLKPYFTMTSVKFSCHLRIVAAVVLVFVVVVVVVLVQGSIGGG